MLQVQRKEIDSHLREAVRPHVDLAFAKLTSTQEELKRSQDLTSKLNERVNTLERQFKLLEAKFNDQQCSLRRLSSNDHVEKVNALEKEVGTFQKRAVELEDRVETVEMILKDDSKKVDSLEKSFHLLKGRLNPMRRIDHKESASTSKDFAMPSGEEICLEVKPGVWEKEWKIQGLMGFLNLAEKDASYKIWSNPFFLGEKGYKIKLGAGLGPCTFVGNSYLAIHLVIMKGENDVILPWPFFNLVTYKVIDQQKNLRERQHWITSLKPNLADDSCKKTVERPKLEENPPLIHNWLIPLSRLSQPCYLLNNTLIINVVIGPRCKNEKQNNSRPQ